MKSFRPTLALASGVLLACFFQSLPLLAGEGAPPDPADSPTGVIFRWLNFALVFGAIVYLVAKYGGAFFSAHAKEISARIVEATAVKAEADRELSVAQAKLAHLDQDVAELRAAAQKSWAAEAERLRASGAAEIEKIQQSARAELAASERAAHQQVRELAASLAVERAAALVGARMNSEIRAKMFQSFLSELGKGAK